MLYEDLAIHCAPTLAGLKTGNLFPLGENKNMITEIRSLNKILTGNGLRLIPVKRTRKHTLIYLYRPERLRKDLESPVAADILKKKGYPCENPNRCVSLLMHHLSSDKDFPHEVGLFLGYPPDDVKCFLKNTRKGVKCVGCWKAYGDVRQAEDTFEAFKKCTAVYKKLIQEGKTLEGLIIPDGKQRSDIAKTA